MPGRLGPSLIRSHCSGASGRERPWNALQRLKPPSVGQLYRSAAGAAPPKGRKLSAAYRLGTKPEWLRKETVRAEASPTLISCHCPITTEAARLPRFSEEPALSQAEGWATRASTPSHSAPSPLGAHPIEGPPPKRLIPDVRGTHPSQAQGRPFGLAQGRRVKNREAWGSLYFDGAGKSQNWASPRPVLLQRVRNNNDGFPVLNWSSTFVMIPATFVH